MRPIIFHYLRTAGQRQALAQEVFSAFRDGVIRPIAPLILPLVQAAQAHRVLEARQSPGGVVLTP